ncbi:MAG TPA: aldehyde dehydrogenase family protein, partial [Ilumatobacteraceae bacterium]|nr:aldehyde dehydrogenase family protein [Ilumatobacteraceae bacterium]
MQFPAPGSAASSISVAERYDNYIGGKWVAPVNGRYFENISPVDGKPICEIARSTAEDIDLALDAAHAAREAWGATSATERSNILLKIADRLEANLEALA